MKKKLLSLLCILAMIASVMPAQLIMAADPLTPLSIISGNTYEVSDVNKYSEKGYTLNYVGNTTSYTWDSSLLNAETGTYDSDPDCVKLKGGNVGNVNQNATHTVWNSNQISHWDLGAVYPLNKVDIWARYNLCNVKIYAKANKEDEYTLVASHQAEDATKGSGLTYYPFDFNGVDARYVKVAVSNVSDDGTIKRSESVVTEIFMFQLDESAYNEVLAKAKEAVLNEQYTEASRTALQTAITTAEATVADERTQTVVDAQTTALKNAFNALAYDSSVWVKKSVISGNTQNNSDIAEYRNYLAYDISYIDTGATYEWTDGYYVTTAETDTAINTKLQGGNIWNVTKGANVLWGSSTTKTDTLVWDLKRVCELEQIDFFQRIQPKCGVGTVTIEISKDGETYETPIVKELVNEQLRYKEIGYFSVKFEEAISAQKVRITFDAGSYKQYILAEVVMFGDVIVDEAYNEALAKAKEAVAEEKYTDATRNALQEAIDAAEAAVAENKIQSVLDEQTAALNTAIGNLLYKTEYLTDLRVLSGQEYLAYDETQYEKMGYKLNYNPVNEAASYTWDESVLGDDGKFTSDQDCTKLNGGNVGKWSDNANYTIWNTSYTSYWDLGKEYPVNKVDIWARYNLCNVKIYVSKTGEADSYKLVASHQATDNTKGADALTYYPFDFNGESARYVKIAVSNVSDDGITLGQSVVTEVFIFGLNTDEYNAVLSEAKEKVEDTTYTQTTRSDLQTAITTAEAAVAENMTQEVFDEQTAALKKAINNLAYHSSMYIEKSILSANVEGNTNDINKYKDYVAYDLTYVPTGATYTWTEGNFCTDENFKNDTRLQGGDFWNAYVSNGTAWGSTTTKTDTMVWDLKSEMKITEIDIFQRILSNIGIDSVTIESSNDGVTYIPVTTKKISNETYRNYPELGFEQIIFDNEVEARYIKITFDAGSYSKYVLAEVVILGDALVKYPVTVTSTLYEDEDFEKVTTLEGQDYIYATISLYNETDNAYDNLRVYSAIYDGDGKLVKVVSSSAFELGAKSEYSPEIELDGLTGLTDKHTLKTFIWEDMTPVSRVTDF